MLSARSRFVRRGRRENVDSGHVTETVPMIVLGDMIARTTIQDATTTATGLILEATIVIGCTPEDLETVNETETGTGAGTDLTRESRTTGMTEIGTRTAEIDHLRETPGIENMIDLEVHLQRDLRRRRQLPPLRVLSENLLQLLFLLRLRLLQL
jgi:hypothetical protein